MPAASSDKRIARTVELLTGKPPSRRVTVFGETRAALATSRTLMFSAARAIRAWSLFKIVTSSQNSDCVPVSILVPYHNLGILPKGF